MIAITNDLNINQQDFQSFNHTTGIFIGHYLIPETDLSITNQDRQGGNPVASLIGGGSAVEHLTASSGGRLNPEVLSWQV